MVSHVCPICGQRHAVREARAEVAYGRQLTCSPECESERRKRGRYFPARPLVAAEPKRPANGWQGLRASAAQVLHAWVIASTGADLIRAAARMRGGHPHRR
jgi:hypothetical protein